MVDWKLYSEIDFSDTEILKINIDTRDFHCSTQTIKDDILPFKSFSAFDKNPSRFTHTKDELIELLDRLYKESGGKGKWRYLMLDSPSKGTGNWDMKYLRVFKLDDYFVVCNSNDYALSKENLSFPVNQEFLHCH